VGGERERETERIWFRIKTSKKKKKKKKAVVGEVDLKS